MSTLLPLQRNRGYEDSQQRKERPSRKNSPSYSQLDSSKKFTTPSGWQTQYSFSKRTTTNGGCVSTTQTSTSTAPKDPFGLPRIDQVIDSMAGCILLSFLDCYSGYHQIALKEEDQIKTAFITSFGAYAYKTMSFGLKNAGATYQRAIQLCFTNQLHCNMEAYVGDVVVKTKESDSFIPDLEETFNSLQSFR